MFLMMGFFAFYNGFIYNEYISIPLNLFGSCYPLNEADEVYTHIEGCVYPFGIDPVWIAASN
jgi:V-type H+-transporting ATPase subunit a